MNDSLIDQAQNKVAIGDLATQRELDRIIPRERNYEPSEYVWNDGDAYWNVIRQSAMDFGLTDWSTDFYSDTVTSAVTNRVVSRFPTAGGELNSPHPNGGSSYGARHFLIMFWCQEQMTIPCWMGFVGTSSDVQLKFNGDIDAYNFGAGTDYYFNLEAVKGYNGLSFTSDTFMDGFVFEALLFDRLKSHWHDPNKPKNPQRKGYNTENGSGGPSATSIFTVE